MSMMGLGGGGAGIVGGVIRDREGDGRSFGEMGRDGGWIGHSL
jgi:hypothetical protein